MISQRQIPGGLFCKQVVVKNFKNQFIVKLLDWIPSVNKFAELGLQLHQKRILT